MADQPDHTAPSRSELQQLVIEAAAVSVETPAVHRVMWSADPSDHNSACLTVGLPRAHADDVHDAFRGRLIWWPDGIPQLRRVTIISSRIGARHDQYRWWFDLLRTAVLRINVDDECAAAVDGTAAHDATMRAAEIFGIPRLNITVDDRDGNADLIIKWLASCINKAQLSQSNVDRTGWRAQISPQLLQTTPPTHGDPTTNLPLRDRCAVAAGERSYVLACRTGGCTHQLLQAGLKAKSDGSSLCYLAKGPGVSDNCMRELIQLGAIPWLVDGINLEADLGQRSPQTAASRMAIDDGPLEHPDDWLCHWTRPCPGAWPGQPATEYLDELLLGCETADRSALAALLRIIAHRTVLGSVVRDQHRAVSFTAVSLKEFRRRRIYRRHRRRYDFEPWGIAVRRPALTDLGAQPVQYASRDDPLLDQDSVWFQPATDQAGRIDWREEREWRLLQDLRLHELPDSDICLFVDSSTEADIVGPLCDWPVIVVPD